MSMSSMHGYAWRSMPREKGGKGAKVPRGTWRRVLLFAARYRTALLFFLVLVVADALVAVATPVLAGHVVNAITTHKAARTVVWIAVIIAILAVIDAGLSFAQR